MCCDLDYFYNDSHFPPGSLLFFFASNTSANLDWENMADSKLSSQASSTDHRVFHATSEGAAMFVSLALVGTTLCGVLIPRGRSYARMLRVVEQRLAAAPSKPSAEMREEALSQLFSLKAWRTGDPELRRVARTVALQSLGAVTGVFAASAMAGFGWVCWRLEEDAASVVRLATRSAEVLEAEAGDWEAESAARREGRLVVPSLLEEWFPKAGARLAELEWVREARRRLSALEAAAAEEMEEDDVLVAVRSAVARMRTKVRRRLFLEEQEEKKEKEREKEEESGDGGEKGER